MRVRSVVRRCWSVTHIHATTTATATMRGLEDERYYSDSAGADGGGDSSAGSSSVSLGAPWGSPAILHLRSELSITMSSSVLLSSSENSG